MDKLIRPVTFLLILALASGCARTMKTVNQKDDGFVSKVSLVEKPRRDKPPAWVLGKGHPSFSLSNYLYGVGVSEKNSVSANESARSELAKSFKVKIRSVMRDVSTQNSAHLHQVIETQVDTILEGVDVRDGWYDPQKNIFYSFAVLDRNLVGATVRSRINEIQARLPQLMSAGERNRVAGEVVGALSHYMSGYRGAAPLIPLISALRVITRSMEPAAITLGESEFASRIDEIVHNLTLTVVSGNGQVVKSIGGLNEPLAAKVNFNGKPVQGIPVVFQFEQGGGELESKKVSNAKGAVETTVHNILDLQVKKHRISARFDFDQLASRFNSKPGEDILDPLKGVKVIFNYSIKVPEWGTVKSIAWKKGIIGMVNQIIRNIPPGGNPRVGIVGFKNLRLNRIVPFSRILQEDFKTILVQAENLTVKEIPDSQANQSPYELAKQIGLDFYISGSYRMEREGLEIRGQLTETASRHILSSAQVQIARDEIYPDDLSELLNPTASDKTVFQENGYDAHLEKFVFAKPQNPLFHLKVWVDKKDYRIGDTITFNVKSDKDCYLTLLDIGSSGNATVIFPNAYRQGNFIKAGTVYQIPSPGYRFKFDVQGPPGLERIKAVATLTPVTTIRLDLDKGFHNIQRGTTRGTRDIKVMAERFSTEGGSPWAEAYTEIFIYEKEKVYYRGSREVPLILKPKKPIDMIGTFGKEEKLE